MTIDRRVLVEHYVAAGEQVVGCGHAVPKGTTIITLRFGDDIFASSAIVCPECFDAVGRAVNGR